MSEPLKLPEPPFYLVSFVSALNPEALDGYGEIADEMNHRAMTHFHCLGCDSVRDSDRIGITVSYWRSLEDIKAWHEDGAHRQAQALGYEQFYSWFRLSIAKVERTYDFHRPK